MTAVENAFSFKETFRLHDVNGKGDNNYYYHKTNMNSQLRYGIILATSNDNKGEFVEIHVQGNREEVNRSHAQTHGYGSKHSYRGSITLNGRVFTDNIFIIRDEGSYNKLVTFWPEDQVMDQKVGNKIVAPTDFLINLSKEGCPVDPNIVAGKMHDAFVEFSEQDGNMYFKPEVFMSKWDENIKAQMKRDMEQLQEEVYVANEAAYVAKEETAEAKEETAVEKRARKLAEEGEAEAKAQLLFIQTNEKNAHTTSAETGKNSVRHEEVYTLVKSEVVIQYGKNTIEITLEDSFGSITTSWNNWDQVPGRLMAKLKQANSLVGRKVQYDTWGGYKPNWFNNLYLVK